MKKATVKSTVSPATLASIAAVIDAAEYCKNAYFWHPSASAAGRRAEEKRLSAPLVEWVDRGQKYTAAFTVSCSCSHVYASGDYTRDGKKTTLTAVKNSFQRLSAAAESAD